MCGIAGFISQKASAEQAAERSSRMAKLLSHRGPDGHGVWSSGTGVNLVHTRLAIVDLSAEGRQPMVSRDGRYTISFNGEIYNHLDLRRDMEAVGVQFRGHSDTEVLLESIARNGLIETLKKVSGMFAVALYDKVKNRLVLARDRLGEKPLYYGRAGGDLVFGSELKVLMTYPGFQLDLNHEAVALYIKYGYVPAPHCIVKGAFKLKQGHVVEFDANSGEMVQDPDCYWDLDQVTAVSRDHSMTDPMATDRVEGLLTKIISREIRADVPVGCFLSGGIDSSLIAALAQKQLSQPLRTFTIGFEIDDYNEAPEAAAIARHLGTDHTQWIVQPKDALNLIPSLADIYDEPFADSSELPTTLLARLTRKAVTVCLSGDGGDELFGGYNRYLWTRKIWTATRWLPAPVSAWVGRRLQNISPEMAERINFMGVPNFANKVLKVGSLLQARESGDLYDRLLSYWINPSDVMPGASMRSLLAGSKNNLGLIEFMMREDSKFYLPDDIMVKVDRASMSVGLESRAPFLDHELYELVWTLPLSMKVRGTTGKFLTRQILARHVPEKLWNRPKAGFAVPLDHWFRSDLREWLRDLLSPSSLGRDGLFDAGVIEQCIKEHLSGTRNWQYHLWTIAMFQAWLNRWRGQVNAGRL